MDLPINFWNLLYVSLYLKYLSTQPIDFDIWIYIWWRWLLVYPVRPGTQPILKTSLLAVMHQAASHHSQGGCQQIGRVAALVQSLAVGLAEASKERSEQKRRQEVSEFGAAVHDQTSSATKTLGVVCVAEMEGTENHQRNMLQQHLASQTNLQTGVLPRQAGIYWMTLLIGIPPFPQYVYYHDSLVNNRKKAKTRTRKKR